MDVEYFLQLVEIVNVGSQIAFVFFMGFMVQYDISLKETIIDELREIKGIIKDKSGSIISIFPPGESDEESTMSNISEIIDSFPSLSESSSFEDISTEEMNLSENEDD